MECTGESSENATVTMQCNQTGVVFNNIYQVKNSTQSITGSVLLPNNQRCNISIVFSNEAGTSEPFILAFGKYLYVVDYYYSLLFYRHHFYSSYYTY